MSDTNLADARFSTQGLADGKNPVDELSRCYLHHWGDNITGAIEETWIPRKGFDGHRLICPLAIYYQYFRRVLFAIESLEILCCCTVKEIQHSTVIIELGSRLIYRFVYLPTRRFEIKNTCSISLQKIILSFEKNENFDWIEDFKNKYAIE